MTVVFRNQDNVFPVEKVLYADKNLVNAIVAHLLVAQTEAMIDMLCDDQPAELRTRDGVQAMLADIPENAYQYAEDVFNDLKLTVLQAIREANYGAAVTGIKFDLAGDVTDVEVDVTVN